jgi:thioredoxin reductase
MTRALMADPELPNKVMEDRVDDVRPCLACMQGCTDRTWAQLDLTCLVNPAAGRERTWAQLKPAVQKKKVLVVGGGPAGMEAARVAALRGHDVTLWEKSGVLGGNTLLAAMPPRREEFGDLPRWLTSQLPKAGVKVELNRAADAQSVRDFHPDVLVAATGAYAETPENIPGWDMPNVTTVHEVLRGTAKVGERVLMVGSHNTVIEVAEWLADRGKKVYLISGAESQVWDDPEAALANDKNGFTARHTLMGIAMPKIEFLPFKYIKEIVSDGVIISATGEQHPCTTQVRIGELVDQKLDVDTVVVHLRMRPERKWMDGLDGAVAEVYKIGDCLEPRQAIDAMADGGRIGREI